MPKGSWTGSESLATQKRRKDEPQSLCVAAYVKSGTPGRVLFLRQCRDASRYTAEKMANAIVAGVTGGAMSGNAPTANNKNWLSKGDTGVEVTAWQKTLNTFGSNVNADGEFGQDTEAQTIRVQRLVGADPDGCVGERQRPP